MSCQQEEKNFKIYEGSDTQLEFIITEIVDGEESPLDLTEYEKVIMNIRYSDNSISEIIGNVDSEDISNVVFEILSEGTKGKSGKASAEIWGVSGEDKVRLSEVFEGEILHSIKIPEGLVQESA